jgi:hypothetical protein
VDKKNELGLSKDDLANIKIVMNDLIDVVAEFQGAVDHTDAHYAALKNVLDFANFVVSGIIYSNGLDLDADHDHDDDEDGVE